MYRAELHLPRLLVCRVLDLLDVAVAALIVLPSKQPGLHCRVRFSASLGEKCNGSEDCLMVFEQRIAFKSRDIWSRRFSADLFSYYGYVHCWALTWKRCFPEAVQKSLRERYTEHLVPCCL